MDYIPYAGKVYDEKEINNLIDASKEFWLTSGRYTKQFEEGLAEFIGVKHAIFTNSGSSANLLAVSALTSPELKESRLLPGDEVITTACGFPTTLNPIIQNGLVPVFVDVELGTYNPSIQMIEDAISPKTKAIFLPHTLGNPLDITEIMSIAAKDSLWVIEDNCDALGSTYKGFQTGSFGHLSTCSFYPAHHITTGEGGAVLTNHAILNKILLSFRDWGRDCWCDTGKDDTCKHRFTQQFGELPEGYDHKYVYSHIGYNLKATDMQAAIGVAQLEKLPGFIERRKINFERLWTGLSDLQQHIILPMVIPEAEPSWFAFPITVREDAPFIRSDIVKFLEENKIATRMLFGGNLTKQPAYKDIYYRISGTLKNTDTVMNRTFMVGVYPGITDETMDYIIGAFTAFLSYFNEESK